MACYLHMAKVRRKNGTYRKGVSGNPTGLKRDAAPSAETTPAQALELLDQQIVPGLTLRTMDGWARNVRNDGWVSSQTGIGEPGRDKRLTHKMVAPVISYQDAIAIWRGDKIARRAIEDPIDECFRQGYELDIADEGKYDDLKEAVMKKIADLKLNDIVKRAKCMERALGGSAILIGANDSNTLDTPLDLTKVTSIDWLTLLEPIELRPYSYYTDESSAQYGEVEFYALTPFTTVGALASGGPITNERLPPAGGKLIHASRLIVFLGIKVSRYQIHHNVAGSLWGDSILNGLIEALRDFNVGYSAAGTLAVDYGQPVISIDGLMMLIAKNPGDFYARMRTLEDQRSTVRAIVIDSKKEKFERQGTNLAGFPELLNSLSLRLAADVDMPLTLLLRMPSTGIGNDGSADVRFYYDGIKGKQNNEIGPLLRIFIEMIMNTMRRRGLPKQWTIKFHELWQMTIAELVNARLTQGRLDSMMIKSGVLYPNEVRMSRYRGGYSFETQINEKKEAPGFQTPPPNGTPGSPHNPGPGGIGGATPNPNVHNVGGYARKNPVSKGTEPAASEGGDKPPGTKKDRRSVRKDAMTELEYAIAKLRQPGNDSPAVQALLGAYATLCAQEQADHDMGLCDPGTCLLEHGEFGPGTPVTFAGLDIVIESPKGSTREWTDLDGTKGSTLMKYDYGYIAGASGSDGEDVDVYLGPNEQSPWVFVIHQAKCPDFVEYDEDKVMLGFSTADEAQRAYLSQYNDPRFFMGLSMMPLEKFKANLFLEAGKISNA